MAKHDNADCQGFMVPVTVENVPDVELYGELCVPKGRTSTKPASHLVTLAATVDTLHPSHQQAPRWSHRRSPFFQSRLFRQPALDRLWMGRGVVAR